MEETETVSLEVAKGERADPFGDRAGSRRRGGGAVMAFSICESRVCAVGGGVQFGDHLEGFIV